MGGSDGLRPRILNVVANQCRGLFRGALCLGVVSSACPGYRPAAARLPGRTGLIVGLSSLLSLSQLGRVSSHHFADSHSSMHLAILVSISALERLLPKNSTKLPCGSSR